MDILYLSRWLPYPPANGSKIRIYNMLKRLAAQGHQIHLSTFYEEGENPQNAIEHLKQFCSQVECVLYKPFQPSSWQSRAAFFAPKPRSVINTYRPEMAQRTEMALVSGKFKVLVASSIDMAGYGLLAGRYAIPAVLEELEVATVYEQFSRAKSPKERLRYGLTWLKYSAYIRKLARNYKAITVVSDDEREISSKLTGKTPIRVLPNGADLQSYQFHPYLAAERSNQLIFNGALTFNLNYEAVQYFLKDISPLLNDSEPDMALLVTGRYERVDLTGLKITPQVKLTGFVDDLHPLMQNSLACVVPLLRGGGTRLKILEAFALGTPVVATSKGAEGLGARHEEHLLIADTPRDFANAILRLKREPDLAVRLAQNARKLVEERFDWEAITAELDKILQGI
jgi:glycosyltransferase involved in cell wall biosynthesis